MEVSIKFQVLALALLGILVYDFTRNKKLPVKSTKVFAVFMGMSVINVLGDLFTVFTITHMDTVPEWLNRFAHQIFIGSLDMVVFLLFLYVYYLSGAQKRISKGLMTLFCLPIAFAMIFTLFAPLTYVKNELGFYSYGPMATMLYLSILIYLVAIFVILFKKNNAYSNGGHISDVLPDFKRARFSITVGLIIWITVSLVQFITKYWLISSMGVSLMVLYIYISFETPREYMDSEIGTLNRRAFHVVLPEMLARGNIFYLISLHIDDVDQMHKIMGYDCSKRILRSAAEQIEKALPGITIYHSRSYSLTAFVDKEQLDKLIQASESWNFSVPSDEENGFFTPNYHITVLELPTYAKTIDEVYDTLDYCLSDPALRSPGKIYIINNETVEKKNYRMAVLALVTKAIKEKAFDVYYQPIYSAEKKRFSSAEALVRLQDTTTLGFVSPEIFIPLAEEKGLINELGNIIFEKVCSFAARNKLWEHGIDYIEVNLSGVQSVDLSLVAQLSKILQQYDVKPSFFNLEITETASTDGGDMLQYNMDRLRLMGFQFSMDDFGTGYSNLAQMAKVHFELVKLDKSLIWPCFEEEPEEPQIILESCIDMILRLGVNIVAEGVETKEQAEMLISKGVNYLQGYYFSRPINEEAFMQKIIKSNDSIKVK